MPKCLSIKYPAISHHLFLLWQYRGSGNITGVMNKNGGGEIHGRVTSPGDNNHALGAPYFVPVLNFALVWPRVATAAPYRLSAVCHTSWRRPWRTDTRRLRNISVYAGARKVNVISLINIDSIARHRPGVRISVSRKSEGKCCCCAHRAVAECRKYRGAVAVPIIYRRALHRFESVIVHNRSFCIATSATIILPVSHIYCCLLNKCGIGILASSTKCRLKLWRKNR